MILTRTGTETARGQNLLPLTSARANSAPEHRIKKKFKNLRKLVNNRVEITAVNFPNIFQHSYKVRSSSFDSFFSVIQQHPFEPCIS